MPAVEKIKLYHTLISSSTGRIIIIIFKIFSRIEGPACDLVSVRARTVKSSEHTEVVLNNDISESGDIDGSSSLEDELISFLTSIEVCRCW